ncbi:MAG: ATP-binding protein, partial [Armatimonadetes bacterium]|nr:ATP-binding protein [Armatimonadota bacterium]
MSSFEGQPEKYVMPISRLTVDKLGVKLYDKVSAVIAELVANGYDADAASVKVRAPMGVNLATKEGGVVKDAGHEIEVEDNGVGMTPRQVQDFYLPVGAERRNDPNRGDLSPSGRKVMGRKGVGKLAPFGICQIIEVRSAGGELTSGKDKDGQDCEGYLTAHLILDVNEILKDEPKDYEPRVGDLNLTIAPRTGTVVILRSFYHRRVPTAADFARQLAQRFGMERADWKITLVDTLEEGEEAEQSVDVGAFSVDKQEKTEIVFELKQVASRVMYGVTGPAGVDVSELIAGFEVESRFYPVTGWVAYAKQPYRDELMAGVRIYCREKIAAQTAVFDMKAGFTGEHDIRSYLIGELHADWLDEEEDLIQTDRRDILWSHELGQEFQKWGQGIVKKMGNITRDVMKKKAWDVFQETTNIEAKVKAAYPDPDMESIRQRAMRIAQLIAKGMRVDEAGDASQANPIAQLSLVFAPHLTLDEKLVEAAEAVETPLAVVVSILRIARVAELSSFGLLAEKRVKVIQRLESLKNEPKTPESAFQKLIADAPWLINPQWSPILENRTFATLKKEFALFYKSMFGEEIDLTDFGELSGKRCDLVLLEYAGKVQMVEIKVPGHALSNEEMDRMSNYAVAMKNFLDDPGNKAFRDHWP